MALADYGPEAEVEEYQGKGIESLKRMFRQSEEACSESRRLAHRDYDWYDNFDDSQWSDAEKTELRRRGQPVVTSNRIKRKVNFLCGVEQKTRSDPRAYPRNPQDAEAADVVTDILDFIETETRFDNVASRAFRDLVIGGLEIAEVIVEGEDIRINLIDFDRFFYDPRSCEPDFSDARYLGYQDWFDVDDARAMFPNEQAEAALHGSLDGETLDEGYEDKPHGHWGDSERQRVRVACVYHKIGEEWHYAYFTGGGVLDEGVSRYADEDGKPCCPIIAASAYVTRNNERYGAVRDMIAPQSEMNYRRSMSLFLIKNRRLWARDGVLPANAKEQVARADGVLKVQGVFGQDWGFIDSQAEISGNFELLQEAKSEIEVQGPNAGLQGRGVESQSGRAIALQQNAGMAEENTLFDTHNDWKLRIYRAMWARAKQFWQSAKWVRVTDDENAARFVGINQVQPDPMTGQPMPMIDPQTGQPMPPNVLAKMDTDIVLEAAPDMITLQHEEFQQLAQMAGNGMPIPPDVLIEASQIRDKQKLLERLKEEMSAQGQLAQAQEMIKQLQSQLQKLQAQPPTPMDMAKLAEAQARMQKMQRDADREDAKAGAVIDKTRADTMATVASVLRPPSSGADER